VSSTYVAKRVRGQQATLAPGQPRARLASALLANSLLPDLLGLARVDHVLNLSLGRLTSRRASALRQCGHVGSRERQARAFLP
jgi:hypothetical protein